MRAALGIASLLLVGCAAKQIPPASYRLVSSNTRPLLVPPGVPTVSGPIFRVDYPIEGNIPKSCRAGDDVLRTEPKRSTLRIVVDRDALISQPSKALSGRMALLENAGCVARGNGAELAKWVI